MIDGLVSFAIERLGDYLIQQVVFLIGVRDEVKSLKKELEWMHSFIDDAQRKQIDDFLIQRWLFDIIDIAYDCEDVLDQFMINVHDEGIPNALIVDQASTSERGQGLFTFLKNFSCICSKAREQIDLYAIGKQIEGLKSRLEDVSIRRERYKLETINKKIEGERSALMLKTLRRVTSFQLKESNVVGYEDDTPSLLAQLLDKNKPQRFVISIFGTGGLGKTTFAGKLYHHEVIRNKFNHLAWVSVSQDYDTKDLLQRIIYSLNKDRDMTELNMKSEAELERYLHRSLEGHSYLVVIDDLWHKEAWNCLKRAFPDEKNGSRVIITTRRKDIAEGVDENTFPYALRFLRPDESWQLFSMKAFKNSNVDQGLEQLGKEMVQKCAGLPLAIVVLGGLLSSKKPNEWSLIRNRIWKDIGHNIEIKYLLALSFDDLSSELKVCFLYLGLFPEDHEIKMNKLIRLWAAEGLISQKEETMEDLAEDNLNELINRSLIQIGQTSRGRIKTFRVHDLLRDLAIRKAKELNFIYVNHETENSTQSSTSFRRQAFYLGRETGLRIQRCYPNCRSLLFFDQYSLSSKFPNLVESLLSDVCTRFRLVRVLDLENRKFGKSEMLPEEIGKLIHLKYLGLRNTSVLHLPPSICNLRFSLQTLDLPTSLPHHRHLQLQLPAEIGMLTELKHLIGKFNTELPINNLTKLQTLKYVKRGVWKQVKTEKLVNLRELRISGYCRDYDEFTFDSIANLKSLRILSIRGIECFGSLQPLSHCENLQDLDLDGMIRYLPGNLHELVPNLECLSLKRSKLEDDPMPKLEKLLNLTHLQLGYDDFILSTRKMICSANGFRRLETLCLFLWFSEWEVEEGALPVLRDLNIMVGLESIIPERLRSINISKVSVEACSSIYYRL